MTPAPLRVAALVLLALAAAPAGASAAVRTGVDSNGTRFRLDGATLTVQLPTRVQGRTATFRAQCGRWGAASRLRSTDQRRARRGAERLRFRLSGRVGAVAEWCRLELLQRGRLLFVAAVAQLNPPPFAVPPELVPGPGVREARTTSADDLTGEDGDASFLLDGRVLTFRLTHSVHEDTLLFLGCFAQPVGDSEPRAGLRFAILRAGAHSLTVDLEYEAEPVATSCLAEPYGASDLASARF